MFLLSLRIGGDGWAAEKHPPGLEPDATNASGGLMVGIPRSKQQRKDNPCRRGWQDRRNAARAFGQVRPCAQPDFQAASMPAMLMPRMK
jgi:hypothetical protein